MKSKSQVSHLIRRVHRWLSIAFTLTVAANFGAMARGTPPAWVTYSPLLPLALLWLSGMVLFMQPYLIKRRGDGARIGVVDTST